MKRKTYIGLQAWDMGFDAHLTLIYTGKVNPAMEHRIQEIIYRRGGVFHFANRKEIAMLGPNRDTPVLLVEPDDHMWHLRKALLREGAPNRSQFHWTPHITLKLDGPYEVRIPKVIKLTNLGFY
jgi:hypothetical protein